MAVHILVEKDGVTTDASLSRESIAEFQKRGVNLVEDTTQYLLKLADLKIRNKLGDLKAVPVITVTGLD